MIFLGQGDVAGAASQVLAGRSDSLIVVIGGFAMIVFMFWRDSKQKDKDNERMDRREEAEKKKDERDSESLKLVAESTKRTADATTLMAGTVEKMEHRQERDRRAILSVIESIDATRSGDEIKASNAMRDARTILISGD